MTVKGENICHNPQKLDEHDLGRWPSVCADCGVFVDGHDAGVIHVSKWLHEIGETHPRGSELRELVLGFAARALQQKLPRE